MKVNTTETLLCYRKAAKAMIDCGTANGARIIGACSLAGKKGDLIIALVLFLLNSLSLKTGVPLFGSYSASNFAVRALTQTAGR